MLGEDFTEDELSVMKAVLDTLRKKAGFGATPHRTDRPLSSEDHQAIRAHAVALLREIDGLRGSGPVDLDAAYQTAKLVQVGAIELTLQERRDLRSRFGDLVDGVLKRLAGVLHTDSGEVYINADLHALKKRFVLGHEAGHAVLPDHQAVYAHLDDKHRLSPEFNDLLERQANQFSADLLAKGDHLRSEFDDSTPRAQLIGDLSDSYQMSCQAVARRVAEESRHDIAVAMSFRAFSGQGQLMPPKLYCSPSFESRMRWRSGPAPTSEIRAAVELVASRSAPVPLGATTDPDNRRARRGRRDRRRRPGRSLLGDRALQPSTNQAGGPQAGLHPQTAVGKRRNARSPSAVNIHQLLLTAVRASASWRTGRGRACR